MSTVPGSWLDILSGSSSPKFGGDNGEQMSYKTRAGVTLPESIARVNGMSADEVRYLNPSITEWPVEPGTSVRVM